MPGIIPRRAIERALCSRDILEVEPIVVRILIGFNRKFWSSRAVFICRPDLQSDKAVKAPVSIRIRRWDGRKLSQRRIAQDALKPLGSIKLNYCSRVTDSPLYLRRAVCLWTTIGRWYRRIERWKDGDWSVRLRIFRGPLTFADHLNCLWYCALIDWMQI